MGLFEPETYVLRVGHRPRRDQRITTHVALVARAFGSSGFFLSEHCDGAVLRSISKIEREWGYGFLLVSCGLKWREYIMLWKQLGYPIVHLTMYGILVDDIIKELKNTKKPIMVIVGAEKVPREIYHLADYNVSIGNQPHSEVSALAIFLDRLYNGKQLYNKFERPRKKIIPSAKDKIVEILEEENIEETKTKNRSQPHDTTRKIHSQRSRP